MSPAPQEDREYEWSRRWLRAYSILEDGQEREWIWDSYSQKQRYDICVDDALRFVGQ